MDPDDPFFKKSGVAALLSNARKEVSEDHASLSNPTRPQTPATALRGFCLSSNRPVTRHQHLDKPRQFSLGRNPSLKLLKPLIPPSQTSSRPGTARSMMRPLTARSSSLDPELRMQYDMIQDYIPKLNASLPLDNIIESLGDVWTHVNALYDSAAAYEHTKSSAIVRLIAALQELVRVPQPAISLRASRMLIRLCATLDSFEAPNRAFLLGCETAFTLSRSSKNDDDMLRSKIVPEIMQVLGNATNCLVEAATPSTSHDPIFSVDSDIFSETERLVTASGVNPTPQLSPQALTWLTGTLKNIVLGPTISKQLSGENLIQCLQSLLRWSASAKREGRIILKLIIQISGCLRNISTQKQFKNLYHEEGLIRIMLEWFEIVTKGGVASSRIISEEMRVALNSSINDELRTEIILNFARVFAKLTCIDQWLQKMLKYDFVIPTLTQVIAKYGKLICDDPISPAKKKNGPSHIAHMIVIRVAFIIGNACYSSEIVENNYHEKFIEGKCIESLDALLETYSRLLVESSQKNFGNPSKEIIDLLTKVIRAIGNLSINQEAGRLFCKLTSGESLLRVFQCSASNESCEELILNSMACLANLSFCAPSDWQVLTTFSFPLLTSILPLLNSSNVETEAECLRVFANLTRNSVFSVAIAESPEVLGVLGRKLEGDRRGVLYLTSGILLNIVQSSKEVVLTDIDESSILNRLEGLLCDIADHDVELATILLRIFIVYSGANEIDSNNLIPRFTSTEAVRLMSLMDRMLTKLSSEVELEENQEVSEEQMDTLFDLCESLKGTVSTMIDNDCLVDL